MSPAEYHALIDDIQRDEGLRLRPYQDLEGNWTIGYGRNLSDRGITPAEAAYLLENDIEQAIVDAQSFKWFPTLDPVRQRVIVNMLLNLGLSRFSLFVHLIHAMATRNYEQAATEMLHSVWATQVKGRAARLAQQMRNGA